MGEMQDERDMLMKKVAEIELKMNNLRAEVLALTAKLIALGDRMLPAVMEEKQGVDRKKVKQVKYEQDDPAPEDSKKKRVCGICNMPGHNARTCSNGRNR